MASTIKQSQTFEMIKSLENDVRGHSTMLAAYHASAIALVEKALILWYAPGYDRTAYRGLLDLMEDLVRERFGEVSSHTHGIELSVSEAVLSVRTWVRMSSPDCRLEVSTRVELLEDKWEKSEMRLENLFGLSVV